MCPAVKLSGIALNDPIQHFVLDYVSRRQNLAHTSSAPVIKQQLIHSLNRALEFEKQSVLTEETVVMMTSRGVRVKEFQNRTDVEEFPTPVTRAGLQTWMCFWRFEFTLLRKLELFP